MKHFPAWTAGLLLFLAPAVRGADRVDYARDVKPIFAKHCYACHGPQKQKSGLRLDSVAGMLRGGDSGPALVPGESEGSRLFHAITGTKSDVARMPPKGAVPPEQVAIIRRWIDAGARAPASEVVQNLANARSNHWAFQPVRASKLPAVKNPGWVRNPIDRFILARLEKEGIVPAVEADKVTLIRRVTLDLTGLPPTPQEVDAFLKDESPDAYEKVVDRLLASPHYGERWGRHWLDLARYADSNGFNIDAPRSIWKYRDWVIGALNRDMPFDRFTIEQLAGDLLPSPTTEQRVATGFHRNTLINQEGGIDLEQFRVESVVDRVNTTGAVWLGLTVGCAQCHDHKFDPITQREFYQLFAFFNNADEPSIEILSPELQRQRDRVRKGVAGVEAKLKRLDPTTPERIEAWERGLTAATRAKLPEQLQTVFNVAVNGRTTKQEQFIETAHRRADQTRHVVGGLGLPLPFGTAVHAEILRTRLDLERQRAALKKEEPAVVTTMVMQERPEPRATHVHLGGDFLRKGVRVQPGTPKVLPALRVQNPLTPRPPLPPRGEGERGGLKALGLLASAPALLPPPLPPRERGTGGEGASAALTRLDLARWLVSPDNPLTPRVTMNRVWGVYFGTGIVETENDFGTQGAPPSHPELLDWLAAEFIRQKWSLKAMHKFIVTSATYRQSSRVRSAECGMRKEDIALAGASGWSAVLSSIPHSALRTRDSEDPRNRLLARQARLRLEAEIVRDVSLAASGLLNPKVGGPGVYPPQPDGVYRFTQIDKNWRPSAGPDRYRRGMYTFFWRSAPHPALVVFDAPDSTTACTRRNRSNTPLQALALLNDAGFYEYAQGLAGRVLRESKGGDARRLRYAFRLCLAREPNERELKRLQAFLAGQREDLAGRADEAREIAAAKPDELAAVVAERAAWVMVARVLLNLDEFITRE